MELNGALSNPFVTDKTLLIGVTELQKNMGRRFERSCEADAHYEAPCFSLYFK
jgi:hypothetical protein